MLRWLKRKPPEEKLEPVDVEAVSPLLLPPETPEEEKLAYHPENTILQEDVAMARETASGAGTSGGFGAFQPFLTEAEVESRENPNIWEHDEAPDTTAPQRPVATIDSKRVKRELKQSLKRKHAA